MYTRRTVSRRQFLRAGAAGLAIAGAALPGFHSLEPVFALDRYTSRVLLPVVTVSSGNAMVQHAARARAAYAAMQSHLYRPQAVPGDTTSLYLEQSPSGGANPYSYVWPLSQALGATLDMLGLPSGYSVNSDAVQTLVHDSLPKYWDGTCHASYPVPPLGDTSDRFFDDNAWTGLDLVRAYRLTGDSAALTKAQQVFQYLTTGWDGDPGHPAPGGVFWVDAGWSRDRNTCSTAPAAELALRLFEATNEQPYLSWGQKMYGWVNATLRDPSGLYWDHIDLSGNINRAAWSYNQGTMIGAGALLYRLTGDGSYLDRAKTTAAAALDYYESRGYASQGPKFNAIFFRNLLHLAAVDPTHLPASQQALQDYAEQLWREHRTAEDLFTFPANSGVTTLLDQAAVIQILACLAWDPARYDLLV